jgi:hypothetical protein
MKEIRGIYERRIKGGEGRIAEKDRAAIRN